MNKIATTLLLGLCASGGLHAKALPFTGFYRDVQPDMVTELWILPAQRFCLRLRAAPMDLALSGSWASTDLHNGYHLSLQAESPHPSPYVLRVTDVDPVSSKPLPRARRMTVEGASFANTGGNTVLFGWNSRPALPDNLAPLFAPGSRPESMGSVFELDLPHHARYVFFAHGFAESGYRISHFDTGDRPYLWLRLEPGALMQHTPMSAVFHHGNLHMQGTDFGAPTPIDAAQQRHWERDCWNRKSADVHPPLVPEAEEYRSRLPTPSQQVAPQFWIQPTADH